MRMRDIIPLSEAKSVRLVGGGESYDYFFDASKILYHGTSRTAAKAMAGMIEPRIGAFYRDVYPRAKANPLVFAADLDFKSKIWSACRFAVAAELKIDRREVTVSQFLAGAAVLKIETDRSKFKQARTNDRPHRGVEKFDFVSSDPVTIDRILVGEELYDLFGRKWLESVLVYG